MPATETSSINDDKFGTSHLEMSDAEKNRETGPVITLDTIKDDESELDVGAQALHGESIEYTPEEHDAVRKKIDWRLLPLCAWACGLQLVDKTGLGAAATYGMRADLGMQAGQDYSWCVTIFYVGYLVGAPVMGRLLQRYHAGKVIGVSMFVWSATLLGMLGVKNFAGVMVLRCLLGVFESALVPGLLLISSMWWTTREKPFRLGVWSILNGILPIPFLVIYYGLGNVHDSVLVPWRMIFLVIGLASAATGVLLFLCLPDNPTTVGWLNEREKAIAVDRVARSQTGIKNSHFKWSQAKEAFTDIRVWMIVLQMLFSQAAGSVTTNFLGIVITGFGYTALKAQLYTAPNFACQAVAQMIISAPPTFFFAFRHMKQPLQVFVTLFALTGTAILFVAAPTAANQQLRLMGCILISASGGNYTQIMATISCNIGGFTKKQVTTSMAFTAYCIINIITPQTFLGTESPRYHTGLGFVMSVLSIFIVISIVTWFTMMAENKRRDKMALTDPAYTTGEENLDKTSGCEVGTPT